MRRAPVLTARLGRLLLDFSDHEPPPQARRAGEDDELGREFERFLQTGQPEDEPYY